MRRALLPLALAPLLALARHANASPHSSNSAALRAPAAAVLGSAPIIGSSSSSSTGLLLVSRTDAQCSLTENDGKNYCFADSGSFCSACGSCCLSSSSSVSSVSSSSDADADSSSATTDLAKKSPLLRRDAQKWCCAQGAVCCSGGKCCPSGGSCCGDGCCLAGQECVSGKCLVTTNKLLLSTPSTTSAPVKSTSSSTSAAHTTTSQESRATTRTVTTTTTAHGESSTAFSSSSPSSAPSTSSSLAAASSTDDDDTGLSLGATAAIVVGATVVIAALALFFMLHCRRRRQDRMRRAAAARLDDALSASPPLMGDISPTFSPAFSPAQPPSLPQHLIHPALRPAPRGPSPLGLSYPAHASYTRLGSSGGGGGGEIDDNAANSNSSSAGRAAKPFSESFRSASAAGWSSRIGFRSDSRRSFRTLADDGDTSTVNLDDDDAAEAHFARLLQTAKSPADPSPGPTTTIHQPGYLVYPPRATDAHLPIAASMMGAGAVVAPLAPTSVSTAPPMPGPLNPVPAPLNPVPAPLRPTPPAAAAAAATAPVYAASAVAMERSRSVSSSSSAGSAARARARSIFFPKPLHHDAPFAPPPTRPLRVPSDQVSHDGDDDDDKDYRRPAARSRNPGLTINTAAGGVGIALSCDEALCSPFPPSSTGSMSGSLSVSSISSMGTGSGGTLRWSQSTGTGASAGLRWSQTLSLHQQQQQQQQTAPGGVPWKNPAWNRPQYIQIGNNAWTYAPSPYYDEPAVLPKQRQKQQLEVVAEDVSRPASPLASPRTRNVTPVAAGAGNLAGIKPYREASPGFIAELEGSGPLI